MQIFWFWNSQPSITFPHILLHLLNSYFNTVIEMGSSKQVQSFRDIIWTDESKVFQILLEMHLTGSQKLTDKNICFTAVHILTIWKWLTWPRWHILTLKEWGDVSISLKYHAFEQQWTTWENTHIIKYEKQVTESNQRWLSLVILYCLFESC